MQRLATLLQALEADVIEHVTAFYTYLKAMHDSRRRLADITPSDPNGTHDDDWHGAICNVIYMQFLALESGRRAIKGLVEFEPTQVEVMITILLSELLAYGFLREQFHRDLRERRLAARDYAYRHDVPAIFRKVLPYPALSPLLQTFERPPMEGCLGYADAVPPISKRDRPPVIWVS